MDSAPRFKNPHRISVAQWREESGLQEDAAFDEALREAIFDGVCPVMCREGCDAVEPDGRCVHQCPSLLIAMGLI